MTSRIYAYGQPRPDPVTWGLGTVLRDADGSTGSDKVSAGDLVKIEKILANRKSPRMPKNGAIEVTVKPPTLPGSSFSL